MHALLLRLHTLSPAITWDLDRVMSDNLLLLILAAALLVYLGYAMLRPEKF